MLEIRNLVKYFGPLAAVDGVSFEVPKGQVLGFLGPNGAGKSTTMKMITGFLAPSSGTAVVCGHDILADPVGAKRAIGYLPEGAPAYPDMTPADFLDFIAHIRGYRGGEARARIRRVVEMIHLGEVLHQPIDTLSKGYRRRVGVAQALLHDPPVLILDEPTDGLDPNQKYEMRRIIADMAPDKAIVISTHLLEEVEAVCGRAIIIARGRILLDGTPAELCAQSERGRLDDVFRAVTAPVAA
jgi:ABC-2 type transport system ATP-binding protein